MVSAPQGTEEARHRSGGERRRGALRWVAVVVALLGWLAIGAFGGMAQGSLSQVQENDAAAFLPASAESTRADALVAEFTRTDTLPALVVVTADDDGAVLDPEQLAAGAAFAEAIPGLSLPGGGVLADVLTGPVVAVPSDDGEALLLPVPIDGTQADRVVGDDEDRVTIAVVDAIRAHASDALGDAGLTSWVTGPAGYVADLVSAFGGIDGILLAVALVVVLVILVVVYRSPLLPFTVIATSVFALCLAALVVKPLAGADVLQLNGQSQGILSILVIGAATDYSLLLVARYREELTRHAHPAAAMRVAWRASLEPIAASAGTVIAGLLCLMLSDLGSNASLGPVAAIGIAASFLAALTLLPALLLLAGRRSRAVFWPRMPRFDAERRTGAGGGGLWGRVAALVTGRARRVWVLTALALVALAAFVPTLRADGTGESDVFLGDVDAVTGEQVLAEHFDSGQAEPIQVVTSESSASAVLDAVTDVEGVASAALYTGEAAGGAPGGGTGKPLVVDGEVLVQVITQASAESRQAQQVVAQVRDVVGEVAPEALVGGAAAQRLDTQETAVRDLRTIVPVVLVVIFVMLVLLLRALVAPLVLLAANVLSFAATMGLAALVFNHVLDLPGADATVPLYGFVFLVALGIDYSIFLMTRVREESLAHGTREGVRRGLTVTGGVITSAGLVLAATFGTLGVIPLLFLLQIAVIVASGVLIDTFVVRSLLVPGLVHELGRRSWWPWARRVPND